ncbi:Pleckstrin homology domain containing protein [Cryptosporidium tyzzeri]|nr:Pleckstrin homology domain containing protein [Cryptosporidium tyzzeri]
MSNMNMIAAKLLEDWDVIGHFFQDCMSEEATRECLIILADLHDILTSQRLSLYEKCLEFQEKYRIFDLSLFIKMILILRFEVKLIRTYNNSQDNISSSSYSSSSTPGFEVNKSLDLDNKIIMVPITTSLNGLSSISVPMNEIRDEVSQIMLEGINELNPTGYIDNNNNTNNNNYMESLGGISSGLVISWNKDNLYHWNKQMNVIKNVSSSIVQGYGYNINNIGNSNSNSNNNNNNNNNNNINNTTNTSSINGLNDSLLLKKISNLNPDEMSLIVGNSQSVVGYESGSSGNIITSGINNENNLIIPVSGSGGNTISSSSTNNLVLPSNSTSMVGANSTGILPSSTILTTLAGTGNTSIATVSSSNSSNITNLNSVSSISNYGCSTSSITNNTSIKNQEINSTNTGSGLLAVATCGVGIGGNNSGIGNINSNGGGIGGVGVGNTNINTNNCNIQQSLSITNNTNTTSTGVSGGSNSNIVGSTNNNYPNQPTITTAVTTTAATAVTTTTSSSSSSNMKRSFSLEFLSQALGDDTPEKEVISSFLLGRTSLYSPTSVLSLLNLNGVTGCTILQDFMEREEKWWESIYNYYSQIYIPGYLFGMISTRLTVDDCQLQLIEKRIRESSTYSLSMNSTLDSGNIRSNLNGSQNNTLNVSEICNLDQGENNKELLLFDLAINMYQKYTHLSRILTNTFYGRYISDLGCYLQPATTENTALNYLLSSGQNVSVHIPSSNGRFIESNMIFNSTNSSSSMIGSGWHYYHQILNQYKPCQSMIQFKYYCNSGLMDNNKDWQLGYMVIEDFSIYIYDSGFKQKLLDILSIRPNQYGERITSICIDPQDLTRTGFIIFWGGRELDSFNIGNNITNNNSTSNVAGNINNNISNSIGSSGGSGNIGITNNNGLTGVVGIGTGTGSFSRTTSNLSPAQQNIVNSNMSSNSNSNLLQANIGVGWNPILINGPNSNSMTNFNNLNSQDSHNISNNNNNNNIQYQNQNFNMSNYFIDVKNCSLHAKAPTPQLAAMWVSEIDMLIQKSRNNWGVGFLESFERKKVCQYIRVD